MCSGGRKHPSRWDCLDCLLAAALAGYAAKDLRSCATPEHVEAFRMANSMRQFEVLIATLGVTQRLVI